MPAVIDPWVREESKMEGIKGKCVCCGSENVEHITRVTGFFSKVAGWNRGKVAELSDRNRNKGHF